MPQAGGDGMANAAVAFVFAAFLFTVALWPLVDSGPTSGPLGDVMDDGAHGGHDGAGDGHGHGHGAVGAGGPYLGPFTAEEIRHLCVTNATARECYRDALVGVQDAKGPIDSFDVLAELIGLDARVSGYAHALAHDLGRHAFDTYGDIRTTLRECSYEVFQGCLHGAIEYHFAGLEGIESEDLAVCPSDDATKRDLCVHGIGHGLMLFTNANVTASLRYCDWLPDPGQRNACWGGVFMENLVGFYESKQGHAHHHTHADEGPPGYMVEGSDDPYYPCLTVGEAYRGACWMQMVDYILYRNGSDWDDTVEKCDAAPDQHRPVCRMRVGTIAFAWSGSVEVAVDRCGLGDPAWRPDCIRGIVDQAVLNHFDPMAGIEVCQQVPEQDKTPCYRQVPAQGVGVGGMAAVEAACAAAEPDYVAVCRSGAGLR